MASERKLAISPRWRRIQFHLLSPATRPRDVCGRAPPRRRRLCYGDRAARSAQGG